jgi:hypothetical protein
VAGVASVLPAASLARTENVWAASLRDEYDFGGAQRVHLPASSLQAKVDRDSLELKENPAVVAVEIEAGAPVIVVFGAMLSRLDLTRESA